MIRNRELQSIIVKIILVQLIFAVLLSIVINNTMDKINDSIIERDEALVGNLIKNNPHLEEEIIPYITKEISEDHIRVGKDTLKKYGYTTEMRELSQPIMKDIIPYLQITTFVLIGVFILLLILIVKNEYSKIYKKVRAVSSAAEKVVEGDFDVYLKDEGEGEFNILNHQFNQMANRLKNSLEILKNEKVFLKNTISDISHQLKTPLSSLIILNDLMIEDEDMDDSVRISFLERSRAQLERMEWLIINLLKIARIEAGAILFKREKVYLKDVVFLALESLKPKIDIKNMSIEISNDLNGIFYGDKEWTVEALSNILKNSIEHSGDKGSIKIKIDETLLFSNVTITDHGQGIDEKDLPHIFKRFYKGNNEVKTDSIGIGLNLTRLIVESQGGSISVKSKKGQGTEFTISFLKNFSNLTKK